MEGRKQRARTHDESAPRDLFDTIGYSNTMHSPQIESAED